MKTIQSDPRIIDSIWYDDQEWSHFKVGSNGVTRIEAYGEPSLYAEIPFYAVFKGLEISARVPGQQVTVLYKTE